MASTINYTRHSYNPAMLGRTATEEAELLIIAARTNDTAQIRSLLDDGIKVDVQDGEGMTALGWAIKRRNAGAATLLIEAGADSEIEARDGWTPMSLAIKTGNHTMIGIAMRGLDRHQVLQ